MRTRTADSAISLAELLSNTLAWPTPLCACENRIISSVFSDCFKEHVNHFVFVYSINLAPCYRRVNAFLTQCLAHSNRVCHPLCPTPGLRCLALQLLYIGGRGGNRTPIHGFAIHCVAIPPPGQLISLISVCQPV